jgi:2-oxoglutarate ferredoxin oxidoreductase subunit alpha
MSEFLGLAYFAEVPIVVWDVQRAGPSTGLPTRTSQGDLSFSYSISHGDTDLIILLPGNVMECFEFGWKGLDIAEKFQTPVLILSDLELGVNEWICEDFEYPNSEIDRGKVLWEKELDQLLSKGIEWGRYLDIDNDGIPYRTIPGNTHPKASHFARGTGHDEFAHYSENPEVWEKNLNRLHRKIESSKEFIPQPIIESTAQNPIGLITYGSTDMPVREVIKMLSTEGVNVDYMRIRSIPFNNVVEEFVKKHKILFVVECNRDGQLNRILATYYPEDAEKLISISHLDGQSLSAEWIMKKITQML